MQQQPRERKFEPAREYKVSARTRLGTALGHVRACLQAFEEVQLHGLAQANERVVQLAAILEKEKVASILRVRVNEHEEQSRDERSRLTVKTIVTVRRVKK